MSTPFIGSPEHKELLCRFFIDTHTPFEPKDLPWPDLDEACMKRLQMLPIWDEAVKTEAETAMKVLELGKAEKDPLLSEAISLQGYEEARHAEMLRIMVKRYGLDAKTPPNLTPPADPNWTFMRVGYGECFDSFFAFGLFALARDSGFFTPGLVTLFDPIMQEEGRHIIFHVNWVAYNQAQLPFARRPTYVFRRALAVYLQAASRVRTALQLQGAGESPVGQDNFTMNAHSSFGEFSLRRFVEICMSENERRLAPYDERLERPSFVPAVAKQMLKVMPRSAASAPVAA
ncbi:MAG: ferritin-like domain-containing protein [Elusimicrobia bacterium]|nr:ferritin-like domain-containing protein [Elusimicrobiota bacterium]